MTILFSELQCKEVICIGTGQRLGFISDVQIDIPEGKLCAIVVPAPCKGLGLLGHREDYRIPWECIRKIGPDIVLVDAKPGECRTPRPGKGLLF